MTSQYHKANMCSTLFVICLVHALFWAFDVRWLILGLSVSGFIIDITLFFVTGCSDPGIVPRASEAEKVKLEKLCKQEEFRLGIPISTREEVTFPGTGSSPSMVWVSS